LQWRPWTANIVHCLLACASWSTELTAEGLHLPRHFQFDFR